MPKISWSTKDFDAPQSSSGTVPGNISGPEGLQQGYFHGSIKQGLKTYYSFEQGEASELVERTGIGVNGEIRGASWTDDSFTGGSALEFDGENDDVKIETPGLFEDSGSLSLKFKLRSRKDDYSYFFSHPDSSNGNRVYLLTEHDSDDNVLATGLGDSFPMKTGFTPELDTWHAVTINWENGDYKVFVDGEEIDNGSYSGEINASTDWYIGSQNGERQYQDTIIDDLRVFERTLTQPEIKALHETSAISVINGETLT